MKTIQQLRAECVKLVSDMEKMNTTAKSEGRDLTAEETRDFDKLMSEHDTLVSEIEKEERSQKFERAKSRLDEPASKRHFEPARSDNQKTTTEEPKVWRSLGEQLQAVVEAATPGGRVDPRLSTRAATGLNEAVPSDGGFLVQQDFVTELIKKTYDRAVLASRCRNIPVSANSNGIKINGIDETSRADGSRWGGVQAYWGEEAGTATATKPKFRQMNLNLHKLIGLCYATDEMLEDGVAMEAIINEAFADEFAFKIDDGIFRGSGAGQLLGFMNSPALVTVAKEGSQTADTVNYANVVKMYSRMWARSLPNAVWVANSEVFPQLAQMKIAVGAGESPVYLPANQAAGQPFDTLMGKPILYIEHAAAIGDLGDICFLDLGQYLTITKGGMKAATSVHVRFLYDEQVFRFIYRIDGQPLWNSPLTPYKGASTLSPFITLEAR